MKLSDLKSQTDENTLTSYYISFSDLMVLLAVFFVMMISMSKVDTGSFEQIRSSFTGSTKGTLVELATQLNDIIKGVPGVPGVQVHLAKDGVRLDLDTGLLFNTGSAKLRKNALIPLKPLLMKIKPTRYSIDVEGHTDDVPLYRFFRVDKERHLETNWSLSGRRASSVIHHLLKSGFKPQRIRLVGYASNRPIVKVNNKKGRSLKKARAINRRVALLIK